MPKENTLSPSTLSGRTAKSLASRRGSPCIAILMTGDRLYRTEALVAAIREQGWQVLDLRFFGRRLPRGRLLDGVFTDYNLDAPEAEWLRGAGFPIVSLGVLQSSARQRVHSVLEDRAVAGRLAADHFAQRRFRHLGFVGYGAMEENRAMYDAMRDRAGELGCECHLLKYRPLTESELKLPSHERSQLRREELASWLREIPKPIGMLAWSDNLGGRICAAADQAELNIPSEVAVMGYGNKASDCECTLVPLSSIDPDIGRQAAEAVQMMQRLIAGEPGIKRTILVPPSGVQVRESTDALAVVDPMVASALHYMWDNLDLDLGVNDIASAAGTSRRTLERAFRTHLGSSIRSELLRRRIDQLKILLRTTDSSIADLATLVGFSSAQYLSNAFRRTEGVSPMRYRMDSEKQGGPPQA